MRKYAACDVDCTKEICLELAMGVLMATLSVEGLALQSDGCSRLNDALPELFPDSGDNEASVVDQNVDGAEVGHGLVHG